MASENTHLSIYELDKIFKQARKIFFVGIGGISMSSLAEYCIYNEKIVFGYDRERNEECRRLEKLAHIRYCSTTDSVMGMDLVVFSNAIDNNCFELKTARALGIPTVSRANFLAYLMSDYRVRIGVSGTHGKSTVTAMLSHIFRHAGYDPTVICGARMKELDAPYRFGRHEYFIFEACEYMNSFLSFIPSDAVVTNIDFDHPDFFSDIGDTLRSFRNYILSAERVYLNADDAPSRYLCHPFIISFGIDSSADYMAKIDTELGKNAFYIFHNGKELARVKLRIFGKHNIYNALCAFAIAHEHKIPPSLISRALSSYEGISRRQELIKEVTIGAESSHSVPLFVDYAHHPTEIKASLNAFKEMGFERILCIFQAHTFSRTHALYGEFLSAFTQAHKVIIAPIYSAREKNIYGIGEDALAKDIGGEYISELGEIVKRVKQSECDCIVIMGAGDIVSLKNFF